MAVFPLHSLAAESCHPHCVLRPPPRPSVAHSPTWTALSLDPESDLKYHVSSRPRRLISPPPPPPHVPPPRPTQPMTHSIVAAAVNSRQHSVLF